MYKSLVVSMDSRSRKTAIITSIVLLLAGIAGIALPQVMSMAVAFFAGWLLLVAGVIAFYITGHGFRDHWAIWLKPFALITVGLLILLHPLAGTAALGLVLAVYFLLDGFAGASAARELRPRSDWGWLPVALRVWWVRYWRSSTSELPLRWPVFTQRRFWY